MAMLIQKLTLSLDANSSVVLWAVKCQVSGEVTNALYDWNCFEDDFLLDKICGIEQDFEPRWHFLGHILEDTIPITGI